MGAVHSLVAEILRELIYALEASDYQTLEVKFIGYTQIEGNVERVVVGDERARRRSAGNRLENRGLHLDVSMGVEELTHGVEHARALQENILNAGIDHKVDIALTITHLRICERVVSLAVLHLHHGERTQTLGKHRYFLGVDGDFSHLCTEHVTTHTDEIADIKQFFEHHIVHVLVFARTEVIAGDVNLDPPVGILQLHERSLTHDAAAHDAAGHRNLADGLLSILEIFLDLAGMSRHFIFGRRVGFDSPLAECVHAVAPHYLLFA